MYKPIPTYFLWFTPDMMRGDRSLEPEGLLGCVIVRAPAHFRARLVLRRRPGPRDMTSGLWVDQWGKPLCDPFDSGEA
jgi:hypothetical protein